MTASHLRRRGCSRSAADAALCDRTLGVRVLHAIMSNICRIPACNGNLAAMPGSKKKGQLLWEADLR